MRFGVSPSSKQSSSRAGLRQGRSWVEESSSPRLPGRAPTRGWWSVCAPASLAKLWSPPAPGTAATSQSQADPQLHMETPKKLPLPQPAVLQHQQPPPKVQGAVAAREEARAGGSAQVQSSAKTLNYSSAGVLSPSTCCADRSLIISSIQERKLKRRLKREGGTAGAPHPVPRFAAHLPASGMRDLS